jgi:hypothetical protein
MEIPALISMPAKSFLVVPARCIPIRDHTRSTTQRAFRTSATFAQEVRGKAIPRIPLPSWFLFVHTGSRFMPPALEGTIPDFIGSHSFHKLPRGSVPP